MIDALIIGKGPAGISAALYLKRAGIETVVIGKDNGALSRAEKIENFFGQENPVSGDELIQKGTLQIKNLGVDIYDEEVINIEKEKHFYVKTNNNEYEARTVLLATGKARANAKIEGFEKFKGKGISFCAVCDGFFYKNKKIALIGSGDYAANEYKELLNFTKDITVFTNGEKNISEKFPENANITYDPIISIDGDDRLSGITTKSESYKLDGIFVAIGTASAADFALKMGVLTDKDNIIVDEEFMTNIDGLYAAGDTIGGFLQIAKAVSDGAQSSIGMIKYIKNEKKERL